MFCLNILLILILISANDVNSICFTIRRWNELVRHTNTAMNRRESEICFEPFRIEKPEDKWLVLNRPISLNCNKYNSTDRCVIEGNGNHFLIAGGNAKATIKNFTFVNATKCAIRILSSSRKSHIFKDCEFNGNQGSIETWRGGAIKTEPYTSLMISGCTFNSNVAAGGGAIFHRGRAMSIVDSVFTENSAKEGGAIRIDAGAGHITNTTLIDNSAFKTRGGAIEMRTNKSWTYDSLFGYGNSPCDGIWDHRRKVCKNFTSITKPNRPSFVLGELSVNSFGLKLSTGLSAKMIARAGQKLIYTSPESDSYRSLLPFHSNPDGAAVFKTNNGWIYMSNAENANAAGGVYSVEFDLSGYIRNYESRLTGTTRNCSGGATPWNTWVSCEEYARGQCWQVDPMGLRKPAKTKLVESTGGNFESIAYDISEPGQPYFFVTEDHERGALRRFTTTCKKLDLSWNLIQLKGKIDYLYFTSNHTFEWTPSLDAGRDSAQAYYRNVEGISFTGGILSFVAKKQKLIFHLNLAKGTYTVESTNWGILPGGGEFGAQPDQIIQNGDYLYFTEDGGGTPGVYVTDGKSHFTVFEAHANKYRNDETTGLAFSPDGTKLYVCIQEIGYLFEITRDDGFPFPGNRTVSSLRWHNEKNRV